MWNGFEGEYGHKAVIFLIIFVVNATNLSFANLENNSFDLLSSFLSIRLIYPTLAELFYFCVYIIVFWILFVVVPGKVEIGPVNNSGKRYHYKLNSLNCMLISMVLQIGLAVLGVVPLETMSKYFSRIILCSVYVGNFLSILIYLKGRFFPTYDTLESKGRNEIVEDFYSGIELVPRFTSDSVLDLKLFSIGHIGMITWQLSNMSHAAYGWNRGSVDALVVCLLQAIYVFDWAIYERWYLYTVDMQHDRLGFYLTFGAFSWMTNTYSAYGYYASHIPADRSTVSHIAVISLYLFGYWMMRTSNNQKENFRKDPEKPIWGKKPQYMVASYKTTDGVVRQNKLLLSGFWGWARHFNYIGDFLLIISLSILCGFHSLGAHVYTFQLTGILTTRALRDDARCGFKYGEDWKKYKQRNPYLLIPGVW